MVTLKVSGMTCGHCAQTVTKALEALPTVERALVDLKAGEVSVEERAGRGIDPDAIRKAIEDAGYTVEDAA